MKMVNLTLPPFAWVMDGGHDGHLLEGRNVILHIRSMSIIEIFLFDDVVLNDDVISYKFGYINQYGVKEKHIAALHHCGALDPTTDRDMIINEILAPAAEWYRSYCDWEDENIINERDFTI